MLKKLAIADYFIVKPKQRLLRAYEADYGVICFVTQFIHFLRFQNLNPSVIGSKADCCVNRTPDFK